MLLAQVVRAQAIAPKRVVVLYWDNKEFPGNARFEESFKAQLQLDPSDRMSISRSEEDMLDIPAFLRRQAN